MKQVNEMPTSGQFVVTWVFGELPWCQTCRWEPEELEIVQGYNSLSDEWQTFGAVDDLPGVTGVEYHVID